MDIRNKKFIKKDITEKLNKELNPTPQPPPNKFITQNTQSKSDLKIHIVINSIIYNIQKGFQNKNEMKMD